MMNRTGKTIIHAAISGLAFWVVQDASLAQSPVPYGFSAIISQGESFSSSPIGSADEKSVSETYTYTKHAWTSNERLARLFHGRNAPLTHKKSGEEVIPVKKKDDYLPSSRPFIYPAELLSRHVPLWDPSRCQFANGTGAENKSVSFSLSDSPLRGPPTFLNA